MCPHPQFVLPLGRGSHPPLDGSRVDQKSVVLAIDQLHCLSQPGIAFKARHVRRPQPVRKGPRRASGCSPAPVLKCDQSRTARSHCVSPVTVYMRAHAFLSTFDGYPRTVNSRSLWHKLYHQFSLSLAICATFFKHPMTTPIFCPSALKLSYL